MAACVVVSAWQALAAPRPADYDVFIEAESPSETNGFMSEGTPRAQGCSEDKWLNLWRPSPPPQTGYFVKYRVQTPQTGKYWVLVWAQGLDTGCSSPFWVTIDNRRLHFTPKTAAIPAHQYRYGQGGMAMHYLGPVTLKNGNHTLTLTVNERRRLKTEGEKQGAYNLIVDAIALTSVDPVNGVVKAPAALSVDVQKLQGPFVPLTDMSQGGIGEVRDPNFWGSMAPMLKKIGLREVRIDHIWDYYDVVSRDADGKLKYDWQRFDRVLDQIQTAGARPFLCISYMPGALVKSGQPHSQPDDFRDWTAVCAELARHMTQDRKMPGLSYEVWNEPDGFWTSGKDAYLKLYSSSCGGVLSGDPTAKIGGPATALNAWIEDFVGFVKKNKLPLNFVSWHWYNCTFDVKTYADQIDRAREILRKAGFGDNVETFFTEWNFNGSVVSENDSFYNAGNMAATLGVFHEKKVTRAFFFMPKDPNGAKDLAGWYGAITWTNKPKPVYNAFDAYSRLKGRKAGVKTSDSRIGAFATVEDNTYRVLVWHFDGSTPFGLNRTVQFSVNLPSGEYEQSTWLIDRQHSNLAATPQKPELTQVDRKTVKIEGSDGYKNEMSLENGGVLLLEFRKR